MAKRGVLPVVPASSRFLRVYGLDPLEMAAHDNTVTAEVPFEPLRPGPLGARVEVIDYDPARRTYYTPVDLDDPHVLAQHGLAPSESDPRFHQQMVYAVVMMTLRRFEFALGRRLRWGTDGHRKLRIYPHGTTDVNAYFDAELGALVFGYFRASRTRSGRTLPGGYVFTCLSHSIIAHETTHALVHAMRSKFMEPSNPDTPAFHEAFADIVAILQHFTLPGVVENAIQMTRASLDDIKPLVNLGRQFGDAIGVRGTLRAALGEPPDPRAIGRTFEPHERGAILVAALFSALIAVYRRRSRDLLRIATGGTGLLPAGELAPDLTRRLADEVRTTAKHYLNIVIRALDYCPPVDIEFGEFLRAMVTADRDLEPHDPWGYRTALIEAFRERGIYPKRAFSLAEESVVWEPFEGRPDKTGIDFARIRFDRLAATRRESQALRDAFTAFVGLPRNRRLFQLHPTREVMISSVEPLRRIGPDKRIHNEVVVEVLQSGPSLTRYPGAPPFRSGATLIVGEQGVVRYVIFKSHDGFGRMQRQEEYIDYLATMMPSNAFVRPSVAFSFARLHQGL